MPWTSGSGMTVYQPPSTFFTPKDDGHAQRQVLLCETADLPALALDRNQDDEVFGAVRLDDLKLAALEELGHGPPCCV
jgi:hypothetical protein